MKFIVLGANSFSGNAFCSLLGYLGHEFTPYSRPYFDLLKPLDHDFGNCDAVVNFAALNMVGESWEHASDYYRANVVGISELAKKIDHTIPFIQVSTPEVYGNTNGFLTESEPFRPSTPYAVSRAASDMHLMALHKEYGYDIRFTRSANAYGPGQQLYRIIPKTIMCALGGNKLPLHGGGLSTRSFIHIRDVARGIYDVAVKGRSGHTYHMASRSETLIADLVKMICKRLGVSFDDLVEHVPDRPGKDPAYRLDDKKIRADLHWTDREDLNDGLDEVISWAKKNYDYLKTVSTEYRHADHVS